MKNNSQLSVNFLALKTFLDALLHAERFAGLEEPNGVWVPPADPARTVQRIGLVLEPTPGWLGWVEREKIDALFVHRPWDMGEEGQRALADAGVGALAYHLAFDERLTPGFNPTLAAACVAMRDRDDFTEALKGVDTPVLWVFGDDDAISPPSAVESLVASLKQSTLTRVPSAGHMSPCEQPQAVADAIAPSLT